MVNVQIKNEEIAKCNECGTIYDRTKQCPDSDENRIRSKDESIITPQGGNMDTLIRDTLSMTFIDSGCKKKQFVEIIGSTVFEPNDNTEEDELFRIITDTKSQSKSSL